jgi:predicted dehydrogenase
VPREINVGIVGCGEVTQIIHLPALRELRELFRVTALCDISGEVLAAVGADYPEAARYTDAGSLVRDGQVDAVLVANPNVYHAEVALAAIEAGKHVLVEKPMCVTLAECDALAQAEAKAGVTVQVGYMRRYAPAFLEAVERLAPRRSEINLARVHDVIGSNALIIDSTSKVHRASDIGDDVIEKGKALLAAKSLEAVGEGTSPRAVAYALLLGLGSHDISAMRELIGMPEGVLYAAQRSGGRMVSAAFDYGHFVCQFETGVNRIPHFDAYLEVATPTEIVRVDYETPYIRHLPARLTVTSAAAPAGVSETRSFPTRNDSFVAEWRAFHENITGGKRPKTSIEDSRQDLMLFKEMVALMK